MALHPSPVTRTRAQAQAGYDRLSGVYDWLAGSEAPFRRRAVDLLAPRLGERVLEIGAGSGDGLLRLARAGALPVGLDLSAGMIFAAAAKLERDGQGGAARLAQGDAARLPFSSAAFDALLMTFTLELFDTPEIPLVLGECRRVLRGGGRLCAASLVLSPRPNGMVVAYEWFHRVLPAWVDCRPIPLRDLLCESGFHLAERWSGSLWGLPVEIAVAIP